MVGGGGGKNWFKISGVSKNQGFEKSGVKLEVPKIEGSKNRNSTVYAGVRL